MMVDERAIRQSVDLLLRVLRTFPIQEQITMLEELLSRKTDVESEMQPSYGMYVYVLHGELARLKQ
jgi:hypothetical protein